MNRARARARVLPALLEKKRKEKKTEEETKQNKTKNDRAMHARQPRPFEKHRPDHVITRGEVHAGTRIITDCTVIDGGATGGTISWSA